MRKTNSVLESSKSKELKQGYLIFPSMAAFYKVCVLSLMSMIYFSVEYISNFHFYMCQFTQFYLIKIGHRSNKY